MQDTRKEIAKGITPSQTVGPYFAYGLTPSGKYAWNDAFSNNLVTPDTSGDRIRVGGRVFDGETANAADPVLALVPADRRTTLIATRKQGAANVYHFDVHLQGDNETVFFDV